MIRGVLLDLDGVLYNGDEPIRGAAAAVRRVRKSGMPLLFVTNTTSRPRTALARKLADLGVPADPGEILTPPVAAAAWMRARADGPAALFVPDPTLEDFKGLEAVPGGPPPRYVVVGDLGPAWTFRRLNAAFRMLHADARAELVALGLTRFWRGPDGPNLDVAPFVAALECAADRRATVMGKPSAEFFRQAATILGVRPKRLLMVGDDLRSDALGARRAGLLGALVRTGKFRPSDLEGPERPDWVLGSVRDLPGLLAHGEH